MAILTIFMAGYGTVAADGFKNLKIMGSGETKMKRRIPASILIPVIMTLVLTSCAGAAEVKLTASDGAAGDYSTPISGDSAIVGAYLDDGGGRDSGSAYVYDILTRPPPDHTNLANITGNFRVNHIESAGSGNATDSYSISVNGVWHNITPNTFRNNGTFRIWGNVLPEVTNVSATPDTILYDNGRPGTPGTNLTSLSANVTDVDGSIDTVTIDLSSIGGLPAQPMKHVSEDIWAVTTNATEVNINAPNFTHQLTINAIDDEGGINNSASIELTVLKRGDVNGDGLVDGMDADYISDYVIGLEPKASDPLDVLVGDVIGEAGNPVGDRVVDMMDALYIAMYISDEAGEP